MIFVKSTCSMKARNNLILSSFEFAKKEWTAPLRWSGRICRLTLKAWLGEGAWATARPFENFKNVFSSIFDAETKNKIKINAARMYLSACAISECLLCAHQCGRGVPIFRWSRSRDSRLKWQLFMGRAHKSPFEELLKLIKDWYGNLRIFMDS